MINNSILIVGATSDIAKELARVYATNGYNLCLTARNTADLIEMQQDIIARSSREVEILEFDISKYSTHKKFYDNIKNKLAGVIIVSGYMAKQEDAQVQWSLSKETMETNYMGPVSLLNIIADDFEKKQKGFIVGVSSVAGDRGRKANYIYGSSKAAFSAYLSGLRNRLFDSGVQVLTVKPGFVNTKMTEGLDLPEKLTAQPEEVARDIFVAQQKGRNILYTKPIWFLIMLIIKNIPEFTFKKLSI